MKAVPTRAPHLPWVCWAVQYQGDPKAFSAGGEGWGAAEKLGFGGEAGTRSRRWGPGEEEM